MDGWSEDEGNTPSFCVVFVTVTESREEEECWDTDPFALLRFLPIAALSVLITAMGLINVAQKQASISLKFKDDEKWKGNATNFLQLLLPLSI